MRLSILVGLLRIVTGACAAGIAIYIEPSITPVAVASIFGFTAGYFTRMRDSLKGK